MCEVNRAASAAAADSLLAASAVWPVEVTASNSVSRIIRVVADETRWRNMDSTGSAVGGNVTAVHSKWDSACCRLSTQPPYPVQPSIASSCLISSVSRCLLAQLAGSRAEGMAGIVYDNGCDEAACVCTSLSLSSATLPEFLRSASPSFPSWSRLACASAALTRE